MILFLLEYVHTCNLPAQFVLSNILECDLCYCNCSHLEDNIYNQYNYDYYIHRQSITNFRPLQLCESSLI